MDIKKVDIIKQVNQSWDDKVNELKQIIVLTRSQLQSMQLELLNKTIKHISANSPFYKKLFLSHDLPEKISSLAQIQEIPFTTKQDFRDSYPFGMLAVDLSKVIKYGESTGTMGKPTSSFMTRNDWERDIAWTALSYQNIMSTQDVVFIAIPYELSFAAPATENALWYIGTTNVAVGALNMVCPWDRMVQMMQTLHPTILICTPTRSLRLYELLMEQGSNPLDIGIKKLLYFGEACSRIKLDKIAAIWDFSIHSAYGATETNSLALPCEYGHLHLIEDRFYFELIDPETEEYVQSGRGELVVSTLHSEAMPLLRYRTGDIIEIYESPCECGLPFRRMQHFGRYHERLAVQNKTIFKYDLESALLGIEGVGCFYVVQIEDTKMNIYCNLSGTKSESEVSLKISESFRQQFGINPKVQFLEKKVFLQGMDRRLKPGSLNYSDIKPFLP